MRRHRVGGRVLAALVVVVMTAWAAGVARADGDPGSDVLVNQNLFVGSDAGVSIPEQVALNATLRSAQRAGVAVRVAMISHAEDLGAITALWHRPRAYARFLGYELSLAYRQRLLVVMPNGFGFYWQGHATVAGYRSLAGISIGAGGGGLAAAAETAVARLATGAGARLSVSEATGAAGGPVGPTRDAGAGSRARTPPGPVASAGAVPAALFVILGVAALGTLGTGVVVVLRRRRRRRGRARPGGARRRSTRPTVSRRQWALTSATLAATAVGVVVVVNLSDSPSPARALAHNPYLDPGSTLPGRPAPGFTLSNQSGRPVSLSSYRGKVVLLAFNDSECTTICPLTTTAMLDAKRMLGRAGSQVQLLGIDADPKATSIEDVLSYSQLHGMLGHWQFLTGSLPQLEHVWRRYGIQADVERGLISHTPALYMIDTQGRLRKLYLTQQSYSAVGQLGQLLAREASSLLPDHPRVRSDLPYTPIPRITPAMTTRLSTTTGHTVGLGPSGAPHLYLFFATWDREVTSLGGQLDALDRYESAARAAKLPRLTAIDEASVEPAPGALTRFLARLPRPLSYPVAIDRDGRVADGYQVLGQPWLVLTSPAGQILWYWNVDTQGWPSRVKLTTDLRAALARAPKAPATSGAAERQLRGSPAGLAALHAQAGQLLGSEPALSARIRTLRGDPIVLNLWASWCQPCAQEFKLFAAASAEFGRHVAFLGADTEDSAADARAFLKQHPVSYPSYQTTTGQLRNIAPGGLEGLPTTIYIGPSGRITDVHIGQYASQGTLDADIQQHADGG